MFLHFGANIILRKMKLLRRTAHIQSAEDQQNLHLAAIRKKAVWRVSKRDLACF